MEVEEEHLQGVCSEDSRGADAAPLPMDGEGQAAEAASASGGAGAAPAAPEAPEAQPTDGVVQQDGRRVPSEPFGPGTSRYYPSYLSPEQEQDLLAWCKEDVRFQIYKCTSPRHVPGGEWRLKAPKAEYYLVANGRRPHYKWTQADPP